MTAYITIPLDELASTIQSSVAAVLAAHGYRVAQPVLLGPIQAKAWIPLADADASKLLVEIGRNAAQCVVVLQDACEPDPARLPHNMETYPLADGRRWRAVLFSDSSTMLYDEHDGPDAALAWLASRIARRAP